MVAVPVGGVPGKLKTQRLGVEIRERMGEPAVATEPVAMEPRASGATVPEIIAVAEASPWEPETALLKVNVFPV